MLWQYAVQDKNIHCRNILIQNHRQHIYKHYHPVKMNYSESVQSIKSTEEMS